VTTVFVHGNPTHSEDWLPFIAKMRGPAVALDLPGWGRTERPRHGYTMHGLASFFERFLAAAGISRHKLVVHDWGSLALIGAQRHPEQLERLVIINSVPLLAGYRWHWIARIWRRRLIGELFNATTSRPGMALVLRQARGDRSPMPDRFVDSIADRFDRETRRAVLTLYRSAPEPALAAAGAGLDRIECPALVVWGGRDPYLPPRFGSLYAERIPNAELVALPDAGHWPWVDDESVVSRVVGFLEDSKGDLAER
jgi:pimeloyl-ACP methyl ester carboxylesterase